MFLVFTLLVLRVSIGSVRAGQMNMPLAATMTLATAAAVNKQWWRSALSMGQGLALKPQAIVQLLVMVALPSQFRWRTRWWWSSRWCCLSFVSGRRTWSSSITSACRM